jgi:hypothetical protein
VIRIIYVVSLFASVMPILALHAPTAGAAELPAHELWRQGAERGFDGWSLDGVRAEAGRLVLDPAAPATAGPDTARRGTARSPERDASEPFRDLIPSWNAETPDGTWLTVRLRAVVDGRWTRWYTLGVWSSSGVAGRRQSVDAQDDADARVLTDTLALRSDARGYQVELELASADATIGPSVSLLTVLASRRAATPRILEPDRGAWGVTLDVPERSQMIYPDGGQVWCSPTSTSMAMAYWARKLGEPALDRPVPEVAAGTYDPVYRGYGNWPFNTAYAARHGLVGYVSRFSSIEQIERWITAGVPVMASLAWGPGALANAPINSVDGHLLVIVGFTDTGNVVVNDPAADPRRGQSVRREYQRGQFQALWLASSGGTVYLIHPTGQPLPADGALGAW